MWSFIPPEFYGNIKRIHDNNVQISYPNITSGSPLPKPYGMDGSVTAYVNGSNAWIYTTMRRGGRALYAFNVDRTNPANITLKWKRGCPNRTDDTGCSQWIRGNRPDVVCAQALRCGRIRLALAGRGRRLRRL